MINNFTKYFPSYGTYPAFIGNNEGTAADESIKITIRFLTNEVRADGLKIIIHKKKCNIQQTCTVKKITSAIESELQVAILRKAIIYEKEMVNKNRKKRPKLKD